MNDFVYELTDDCEEPVEKKPRWQSKLDRALLRFRSKPANSATAERIAQAIAGPIRAGLRAGDLDSKVWDVCQTASDREAGNFRVFPRKHTVALASQIEGVRVLASCVLEGATDAERLAGIEGEYAGLLG